MKRKFIKSVAVMCAVSTFAAGAYTGPAYAAVTGTGGYYEGIMVNEDFYELASASADKTGFLADDGDSSHSLRYAVWDDGLMLIMGNGTIPKISEYYSGYKTIKRVVATSGITAIGESAFEDCTMLESVTFSDSDSDNDTVISSVGKNAFKGCENLAYINNLGTQVTSLGAGAFEGCKSLSGSLSFDNLSAISANVFKGCSSLTGIDISESNSAIVGESAFEGCSLLAGISLPENITSLGAHAFAGCESLSEIDTEEITSYGEGAFEGCRSLESMDLCSGVQSLPNSVFKGCSYLNEISIPGTVVSLGSEVFADCTKLGEVSFDESSKLTSIGDECFSNTAITSINLPDSVNTLGNDIFKSCSPKLKISSKSEAVIRYCKDNGIFYGNRTISFTEKSKTLSVGDSYTAKIKLGGDSAYGDTLSWSSDNVTVATVQDGVITAHAKGTCTISAVTGSGSTANLKITVYPAVEKFTISANSKVLVKGGTTNIKTVFEPEDSLGEVEEWSSSNTDVATVSKTGKVTAVSAGSATIIASLTNGKKATCTIKVYDKATAMSLSYTSYTLTVGKYKTLKATVTPASAYQDVTWGTSNSTVATVDSKGKVTAVGKGKATITAYYNFGGKTIKKSCSVTVNGIVAKKVTLSKRSVTLKAGKSCTLKATITPTGCDEKLTWSSSSKSVATVNSSGKITAVKKGTATITVKSSSGKKATCKVTVMA